VKKKDLKLFILWVYDLDKCEVEVSKLVWAKDADEIMKGALKEYVKDFFNAHPDLKEVRAEEEEWWDAVVKSKEGPITLQVDDASTSFCVRELEPVPPPVEEVQTID